MEPLPDLDYLTSPLRARFGIKAHFEYYDLKVLTGIVKRSAKILNIEIDERSSIEIASRSRGTPRIVNALLRRVRDFAQVKGNGKIDMGYYSIFIRSSKY